MTVNRFDIGSLGAVERMENGWLKVPGRFTRTGVFLYRDAQGNTRRELRRPEEVFHPDAIKSFALVPVTVDHPPEMLDKDNTKAYQVGSTGESIVRDGEHVAGSVMLTDAKGIDAVDKNGMRELSCGYSCVLKEGAGMWQGLAYDCEQTMIRGNHLAIVDRGRAGPTARLQLDRMDAVQIETTTERVDTMKFFIHGVEHEVTEQVSQAITRERETAKARLDSKEDELKAAKASLEKEKARADSANEDLAKEKKLRADAEDPEKVKAKVAARLALETSAKKILGATEKLDSLSERDIKVKVVQKAYPSADLKDKSDDYLQARFDSALEKAPTTDEGEPTTTRQTITEVRADAAPTDIEAIRQKTIKEENERWKKAL